MKPDLPVKPAGDRARLVETTTLELRAMAPQAIGFGKIAPKLEWKAIAEVTGKIVYRHPKLEKGQVLQAGTEILRIDPLDYELNRKHRLTSNCPNQRCSEEDNLKQTLKIEQPFRDCQQRAST